MKYSDMLLNMTKQTRSLKYPSRDASMPERSGAPGVGGKEVELTDSSDLEVNHSGNKFDIALDIPQIINWQDLASGSYENS